MQDCVKELTRLDKVGRSMSSLGSTKATKRGDGKEHDAGSPELMKGLQQMGWVVSSFCPCLIAVCMSMYMDAHIHTSCHLGIQKHTQRLEG